MSNKTCGDCVKCQNRTVVGTCEHTGITNTNIPACSKFEPKKPTLFSRITASEEVLAPEFVEMMYDRVSGDYRYYSMLTGEFYNSKPEAIAATLARLKEVCNDTE